MSQISWQRTEWTQSRSFSKYICKCTQPKHPADTSRSKQLLIPLQILWALSLSLCKISILLLYSKIFEAGAFTLLARGTAVFVVLWAIGTILAGFLICQPFAYNWDQSIPDGRCGNQTLSFIVTGSFNVVTDVAVLALPLPYLYRLSLPLHQRLIMLGVFGLGFL